MPRLCSLWCSKPPDEGFLSAPFCPDVSARSPAAADWCRRFFNAYGRMAQLLVAARSSAPSKFSGCRYVDVASGGAGWPAFLPSPAIQRSNAMSVVSALYMLAGRNALLVLFLNAVGVMLRLPMPPRSSWILLWLLLGLHRSGALCPS